MDVPVRLALVEQPQHILNSVFGYESFRPPQEEIIETLVSGGDALVSGHIDSTRVAKMGLTALVPYCVSTASSVGALRAFQSR